MSLLNNNPSSFTLCDWIGVNWKISLGNPLEDYSFLGLWFSRVTLNCRRWKWRVRQGFRNVRYKLGSLEWLQHSWVSIWMCLQDQDRETWRKAAVSLLRALGRLPSGLENQQRYSPSGKRLWKFLLTHSWTSFVNIWTVERVGYQHKEGFASKAGNPLPFSVLRAFRKGSATDTQWFCYNWEP